MHGKCNVNAMAMHYNGLESSDDVLGRYCVCIADTSPLRLKFKTSPLGHLKPGSSPSRPGLAQPYGHSNIPGYPEASFRPASLTRQGGRVTRRTPCSQHVLHWTHNSWTFSTASCFPVVQKMINVHSLTRLWCDIREMHGKCIVNAW